MRRQTMAPYAAVRAGPRDDLVGIAAAILSKFHNLTFRSRCSTPHGTPGTGGRKRSYGKSRTTRNPFATYLTSTSYLKRDVERRYFA
jgi:hypothetical protein